MIDRKSTTVSNATTTVSNSNDKNTRLCDCGWNVHGTSRQDMIGNLCTSQPTQVLQTLWTVHTLDPLYMLFQSALAMHSLLDIIKSVVASQNKFLGSPRVYTGTTNKKLFRGAHA